MKAVQSSQTIVPGIPKNSSLEKEGHHHKENLSRLTDAIQLFRSHIKHQTVDEALN